MENNVPVHQHNDIDCNRLYAKECLVYCPQAVVTKPTGGATVDAQARTAISDIIDKLKAVGITL